MTSLEPLRTVSPAEPAAPWIGGKRHLSRRICGLVAATPHAAYVEPFCGMGGVFLRRAVRPGVEVINDISGDVVNLYRVLQRHPDALFRELRWRPAMRAEFDRLKDVRIHDLTDIERAAVFLYLQRLAFGGKVRGRSFGVDTTQGLTFNIGRLEARLRRLHDRLADVVIEHLDWFDCLRVWGRETTLFYLDPPYWGSEDDYGRAVFTRSDFAKLAEALAVTPGRFLLSINDVPEIRQIFAGFDLAAVKTTYTIAGGSDANGAAELLIARGVDLDAAAPPRLL